LVYVSILFVVGYVVLAGISFLPYFCLFLL